MTDHYTMILSQLEEHPEPWKLDHAAASCAYLSEVVYEHLMGAFRGALVMDANTPKEVRDCSLQRKLALARIREHAELLKGACEHVRPEDYDYQASAAKIDHLIRCVRAMEAGERIWDLTDGRRALDSLDQGEVEFLDGQPQP